MKSVIINKKDNVGICLEQTENIPVGHKYALKDIKKGEFVIKYGEVIGRATTDIKAGEWVHTNNLKSHLDEDVTYSYNPQIVTLEKSEKTFMGFKRDNGKAGVRNEIFIIPTVGCVNNVCMRIEKECQKVGLIPVLVLYMKMSLLGENYLSHIWEKVRNERF